MEHLLKLLAIIIFAIGAQNTYAEISLAKSDIVWCKQLEEKAANLSTKAEKYEFLSTLEHTAIQAALRSHVQGQLSDEQLEGVKKLMICADQIAEKNGISGLK